MEVTAQTIQQKKVLNTAESEIIRTLVYFNIFKHPLTKNEIKRFCGYQFKADELNATLNNLVDNGIIFSNGKFFLIQQNHHLVQYRKLGNQRADTIMPVAKKYSARIASFPFVRAVFISGSLSKGVMQKDSDLDFFIITSQNRLWLCRTLLILYKKIFLLNSHKYFCLNYFISENNLFITDKNLFTAMELVTLLPMHNVGLYDEFLVENKWALDFFPNADIIHKDGQLRMKNSKLKKAAERIMDAGFGNRIDTLCMNCTNWFWKRKYRKIPEVDFENSIRSSKDVSKYHPNFFQHKTLSLFETALQTFETVTGYKLTK